jgi:hypothetical protein
MAHVASSLPIVLAALIALFPISLAAAFDKFDATDRAAFDDISLLKNPDTVSKIPASPTICFFTYRLIVLYNQHFYL